MQKKKFRFSNNTVEYYFSAECRKLKQVVDLAYSIFITDENVFAAHQDQFKGWKTIVLRAGEEYKTQSTVDDVIRKLVEMQADRQSILIGMGGGVVSDLTGFIASVYMRGISFGFVPTSLLAMVDASIGGKNGIDVGVYKNMVGTIRQPDFIVFDSLLLKTLPEEEWYNGFAEIIKHASIKDTGMFKELGTHDISFYQRHRGEIDTLIQRNALLKTKIVQQDEFEKGDRKLLNFGHTLGHALEKQYSLAHGHAISIGMGYACKLSENILGFKKSGSLASLLQQYKLPTTLEFDREKVIAILKMDKKKEKDSVNFILLEKIGKAIVQPVSIREIYESI